jgi:hypothetical protein
MVPFRRALFGMLLCLAPTILGAQTPTQAPSDQPAVSSKINLTMEQRYTIKELIKDQKLENEPRDIEPKVGEVVPTTISLRAMPAEIGQKISQVKNHVFFFKNNKLVLVDPKDLKVVDIIEMQ